MVRLMSALRDLARHHGIATDYDHGPVPDATLKTILAGLGVDPQAPPRGRAAARRPHVPQGVRAHLPGWLDRPAWGVFCQLYELRSARNWGIGDFADLAALARILGPEGADFLGVNPLHALFLARSEQASPFSPSNRRFLNPLYIAPDLLGCAEPEGIAALRAAELVDYGAIRDAKLPALRAAFDAFMDRADPAEHAPYLDATRDDPDLFRHAVFEALSLAQAAAGHGAGWTGWPEALRDPASAEVDAFAQANSREVEFHRWLQYVARRQLAAAQRAAREAGMRLGLYLDLAVGEAPDGSATWSGTAAALPRVTVGAPPDMFSQTGQGWGLAAPSPVRLEREAFEPFRQMIRAQLRDAGALRIDHVMALWQLFLIPDGAPPRDGAHLRYPMAAMLRVLAEESRAAQAVVIGEDLGWVPEGFRPAMTRAGVLSYRIVVFEQDEAGFRAAADYPRDAMACLSTHDLPVLSNWWRGDDIERRRAHGLVTDEDTAAAHAHRARERGWMLARVGLDADPAAVEPPEGLLEAAHRFVAATPCRLAAVRLADLAGPEAPTNLPGVGEGDYPNWRPRCPIPVEALTDHAPFRGICAILREARPR
jgi:4-alpha-glucanotransferase